MASTGDLYELLESGSVRLRTRAEKEVIDIEKCAEAVNRRSVEFEGVFESRRRSALVLTESNANFVSGSTSAVEQNVDIFHRLKTQLDDEYSSMLAIYEQKLKDEKQLEENLQRLQEKNIRDTEKLRELECKISIIRAEQEEKKRVDDIRSSYLAELHRKNNERQALNEQREKENEEKRARLLAMNEADALEVKEIEQLEEEKLKWQKILDETEAELASDAWELKEAKAQSELQAATDECESEVSVIRSNVEEVEKQKDRLRMKLELKKEMFGEGADRTPESWQADIDEKNRQNEATRCQLREERAMAQKAAALALVEQLQAQVDDSRVKLAELIAEQDLQQAKNRALQRRVVEDQEIRDANLALADGRVQRARDELESLRREPVAEDSRDIELRTPVITPRISRRISSQRKITTVSRGFTDDSDGEVISGMRYEDDTIVARGSMNDAMEQGTLQLNTPPLAEKIASWNRSTPISSEPRTGSDSTCAVVNSRPVPSYDSLLAASRDSTMEMDEGTLDISMLLSSGPISTTPSLPTTQPPRPIPAPISFPSTLPGIFAGESDSDDANESVWDAAF